MGKKLSDLTTKRVISLVLSIMISIPFFSISTYLDPYTSYESGIQNLYFLIMDQDSPVPPTNAPIGKEFILTWENYIENHKYTRVKLAYMKLAQSQNGDDRILM